MKLDANWGRGTGKGADRLLKLNPAAVRDIRANATHENAHQFAARYGVCRTHVLAVKRGKRWQVDL